ncbi:MAG: hypothetical protein LQ341_003223 [Variospora aurantia]|nr:MAG: hypothetical protein LQ341_003223 [Variospora aurantia]
MTPEPPPANAAPAELSDQERQEVLKEAYLRTYIDERSKLEPPEPVANIHGPDGGPPSISDYIGVIISSTSTAKFLELHENIREHKLKAIKVAAMEASKVA